MKQCSFPNRCYCTDFNRHLCRYYREPKKEKKGLNQVSERSKGKMSEYNTRSRMYKKENPICRADLPGCSKTTADVHHMKGRGKYLLDESTWLPVCRNCHDTIHQYPKESKELGLLISKNSK